jgi:hypothetical protein
MSVVSQGSDTKTALAGGAPRGSRLYAFTKALTKTRHATSNAVAASREAWAKVATSQRDMARTDVAQRIAALADRTAVQTMQATSTAVAAGRTGFTKAAVISKESVLPEIGRTGTMLRERIKPERLKQDYRNTLIWLHENLFDSPIEKLFFASTKGRVAAGSVTVIGTRQGHGHDYRPTPRLVFDWALSAIDEDLSKLSFVDYGAGKGRALLLASQHPFTAVGGIEYAEELHDAATMNIAQFPRSQMKCRDVECVHDDAAEIGALDGPAVHYFFNPFSREVFAEVLSSLVTSYRNHPRRLYLILIDPVAEDLVEKSGTFMPLSLPPAARARAKLLSPYRIAVYRSLV